MTIQIDDNQNIRIISLNRPEKLNAIFRTPRLRRSSPVSRYMCAAAFEALLEFFYSGETSFPESILDVVRYTSPAEGRTPKESQEGH